MLYGLPGFVMEAALKAVQSFDEVTHGMREIYRRRCVVIGSLSKSHAMTGWRIGWVVAHEALVNHVETLVLSMLYGLPGFVMEAALKAVQSFDEVTHGMREIY